VTWLLRLASNSILSRALQNDPMAFAAWYAAVGSIIDWPEAVIRVQKSARARRLSLDRMMKLLSQVNYAFPGRTNASHARMLLEGYAVHEWVQQHSQDFIALAASQEKTLAIVGHVSDTVLETLSPFAARVIELARVLELSPLERDILSFALLTRSGPDVRPGCSRRTLQWPSACSGMRRCPESICFSSGPHPWRSGSCYPRSSRARRARPGECAGSMTRPGMSYRRSPMWRSRCLPRKVGQHCW
jgi:hypothetical protein